MFRMIQIASSWYRWDVGASGWDLRSDVAFPRRRSSGSPGRSKRSGRAQVGSGPDDRPRPTAAMGNSSAQHQPERVVQRSAPSPEDRGDLRLGGAASDVGSHVGTRERVVRWSTALVRRTYGSRHVQIDRPELVLDHPEDRGAKSTLLRVRNFGMCRHLMPLWIINIAMLMNNGRNHHDPSR